MILHLAIRLVISVLFAHVACAQSNVTLDDTDLSIIYAPAGAWVVSSNSTLDFGGAHMLTQNPNATATFNFTGIAIYFLSPKWPYTVNTQVSLDGAAPVLVDLIDHSRPDVGEGPETVQSAVVWSAVGLNNTQHSLLISVGAGQPFGVVDGLIFTSATTITSSSIPPLSSTTPPTSSTTSTAGITDPTVASPITTQAASSKIHVLPIVLGSLFGLIGIGVVLLALIFAFRRRRRPKSEAWTIEGTQYSSPSSHKTNNYAPMQTNGSSHWDTSPSGYPMDQTQQGAWQNTRFGYVGMAPPPIPQQDSALVSNRYQPGETLSTITEKSTPRMGEAHTSLANSPASGLSGELPSGYYTAPPSDGVAASTKSSSRRAMLAQAPQGHVRAASDTRSQGKEGWI